MISCEKEPANINLKLIDDANSNDCYLEILINRHFLNTIFLTLLIFKNTFPHPDIKLTHREEEILLYISNGYNNGKIAKLLHISVHTTKIHIRNIFQKLEAKDRTEAVVKAIKYGLINVYSNDIQF